MLSRFIAAALAASLVPVAVLAQSAAPARQPASQAPGPWRADPAVGAPTNAPDPSALTPGNPDGSLTVEQSREIATQLIAKIDTNHDGRVSEAEMLAALHSLFGGTLQFRNWKEADTNHDHYISLDEMSAWIKKVSDAQVKAHPQPVQKAK